jgi:hypothetical protein
VVGAVFREHGTRSIGEILLPWVDGAWLPLLQRVAPEASASWPRRTPLPRALPGSRHILPH